MFSKSRGIALFLMLIFILLSAGPIAYAATGKCCPVCTDQLCPMKKQPKKSMSCHEEMAQQDCQFRAGACSGELDGLVFTFLAIVPAFDSLSSPFISNFNSNDRRLLIFEFIRKNTPPPKAYFA